MMGFQLTRFKGVSEVVLSVLIIFYIVPFEGIATASDND